MDNACKNTDRELWRERPGDFYSPSIHVTEGGGIGINVHGTVIVAPVESWHYAGDIIQGVKYKTGWRGVLSRWLIVVAKNL